MIPIREAASSRLREAAAVRPSARQIAWQQLEFYGFIHFGMNTMTDREWGSGHEDPGLFAPHSVDADQWIRSMVAAEMRGVILTAKHHDGFCLWPSAHTSHSVAASPWRGGDGDLVAEVAAAASAHGLALGLYLSPWDRTEASYGSGPAYDDYFVAQLEELLTGYGPLFSVWFDGACGEGPNGRRQVYDWDRYHSVVRRLQPDAVISVCGPDVRWCGNEAGHARADEWSVVPASLRDAERVASRSQQADDSAWSRQVRSDDDDLGSRAALMIDDQELVWYPAEVNTSIRPGWFHHPREDDSVRTGEELFRLYRRSVGGNATFLLNVPPTRDGTIAEPDVAALSELGGRVRRLRSDGVAAHADASASSGRVDVSGLVDLDLASTAWRPAPDDDHPWLRLSWADPVSVTYVVIREMVTEGQQVEEVSITGVRSDGSAIGPVVTGTIGYQRIVDLEEASVKELMVTFTNYRGPVAVCGLEVVGQSEPAALGGLFGGASR